MVEEQFYIPVVTVVQVVKDIDLKKLDFHRFGSDIVHN